ncbi:MAG: HpaII family restriction endonuclease [Clostridium sp.]|nr:HpaII family restriction endonuclease [Clostridium sp.]
MLTATRREWNELYTFFSILAEGYLTMGTAAGEPGKQVTVAAVRRHEHDGDRLYRIEEDTVHVTGETMDKAFPREELATVSSMILKVLMESHDDEPQAPEAVEAFLDAANIYDMEAVTDDRTDMYVYFYSLETEPVGMRIYSRLCGMAPLLDGGRTANLKFEQTGVRFSQPAVNKINQTDNPENVTDVARRILYIESQGGVLKYSDVADKIFRSNLSMIDLHFPRMLADMTRLLHLDNVTRIDELTALIEERNPLKIKDELIHKHGFYRHKIKTFLLALAFGMRPAKMYNGTDSAVAGFIMVDGQGHTLCYTKADSRTFADYLFSHTRLEKSSPEKDKYGYLERENRLYYLKLNLKIGFVRK